MRRILVTGGAGFIGANFIRFWLARHPEDRITNLDKLTYAGHLDNLMDLEPHPFYRFVQGDVRDAAVVAELLGEEEITTIVHFAAESHVDRSIMGPAEFIRTNIQGTFTLLEAARSRWLSNSPPRGAALQRAETPCFLHISTDEVYGSLRQDEPPFTETSVYAPNSPYSATKAASDHLVRAYHQTYGLPAIITHCSNNYGPYQLPEKLIPLAIFRALNGETIPLYGDGENVRDWLYVEDHCAALEAVIERGVIGETYNIGGDNQWKNRDLVGLICDLLDERLGSLRSPRRSLIRFVADREGHDRRYGMDISKIAHRLGWRPGESLASGMAKTVDWYLDHQSWVNKLTGKEYQSYFAAQYGSRLGAK